MKFELYSTVAWAFYVQAAISHSTHEAMQRRDATTATVDLASNKGASQHLASGLLYGIPDAPDQIPSNFYTGMSFNYGRAGGSQIPQRGWWGSPNEYKARFASALSNYKTTRKYGGRFQLILCDLWGADSTEPDNAPFPGDRGNWKSYDKFLDTLIADIDANGMTAGLDIEIWNEPDNHPFWHPSQDQYLQMWGRGFTKLRAHFGNSVKLVGPGTFGIPSDSNQWWANYLQFVKQNGTAPDIYIWHLLQDPNDPNMDPQSSSANVDKLLSKYGLPKNQYCVNEYGLQAEQQPAGAVFYIATMERINMIGLRANYNMGGQLHDLFAGLLGKPGAGTGSYSSTGQGYYANGEWQVYNYYSSMTGNKLATTRSGDGKFDVYATSSGGKTGVKILAGPRLTTGSWTIKVNSLSSLGLPKSGKINIRTYRFDFSGTYSQVGKPVNMGTSSIAYSNDFLTIPVKPATQNTAYAFEFA